MILKSKYKTIEITCLKKQVFLKAVYYNYSHDSIDYLLALRDALTILINYKQKDILSTFIEDTNKFKGVLPL